MGLTPVTAVGGLFGGALAGLIVGLYDASANSRCTLEFLQILGVNISSGALTGALMGSGAGLLGAVAGEVGGLSLGAIMGLNGIPKNNPCSNIPTPECEE